jgi:Ca2+/Na+ antiporter
MHRRWILLIILLLLFLVFVFRWEEGPKEIRKDSDGNATIIYKYDRWSGCNWAKIYFPTSTGIIVKEVVANNPYFNKDRSKKQLRIRNRLTLAWGIVFVTVMFLTVKGFLNISKGEKKKGETAIPIPDKSGSPPTLVSKKIGKIKLKRYLFLIKQP